MTKRWSLPSHRHAEQHKVVLLCGARQTGKTTLLRHMAGSDVLFINLQDRRLRRRYEADEGLFLRELAANPDARIVIVDEIQKAPGLLEDIQLAHDRDPQERVFYVTGSSSRQLKSKGANLLPGRAVQTILTPVLQVEQRPCTLLSSDPPPPRRFPERSLRSYLLMGSLPGFYSCDDADTWVDVLATYTDLCIENKIRQENLVGDMGAFLRFLQLAALQAGQFVNHTKMASTVGVAVNTIRNYYRILQDTYVGIMIPPYSPTPRRVTAAPRFLFFDLRIRHSLADLRPTDDLLTTTAEFLTKSYPSRSNGPTDQTPATPATWRLSWTSTHSDRPAGWWSAGRQRANSSPDG